MQKFKQEKQELLQSLHVENLEENVLKQNEFSKDLMKSIASLSHDRIVAVDKCENLEVRNFSRTFKTYFVCSAKGVNSRKHN